MKKICLSWSDGLRVKSNESMDFYHPKEFDDPRYSMIPVIPWTLIIQSLRWYLHCFFVCVFELKLWLYVFWNGFYTTAIFIQLQKSPFLLTTCCCSVTNWSDSGNAEALRTWTMHYWDPSQWDKLCIEYQRIKFQWKKWVNIFTFAWWWIILKYYLQGEYSLSICLGDNIFAPAFNALWLHKYVWRPNALMTARKRKSQT